MIAIPTSSVASAPTFSEDGPYILPFVPTRRSLPIDLGVPVRARCAQRAIDSLFHALWQGVPTRTMSEARVLDTHLHAGFYTTIALLLLGYVTVALRFYVRARILNALQPDDWAILAALVSLLSPTQTSGHLRIMMLTRFIDMLHGRVGDFVDSNDLSNQASEWA